METARILSSLQREVTQNFLNTYPKKEYPVVDGWRVEGDLFYPYNLKIENDYVNFTFYVLLTKRNVKGDVVAMANLAPTGRFSLEQSPPRLPIPINEPEPLTVKTFLEVKEAIIPPQAWMGSSAEILTGGLTANEQIGRAIFPYDYSKMPNDVIVMHISRPLFRDIIAFAEAKRGFPSGLRYNLARMLYLSAVTLTTLGFGDIVPITTLARILIAIESIFGVVCIGLFLNSLAHETQIRK